MQYTFKDYIPLLLVLLTSIGALLFKSHFPEEDAFILFRYSENLANYGVITYNPGDTLPVEGATDFLWMVLLAGLYKLGISTYVAAKLVSLFSLWGICGLFFLLMPKERDSFRTLAIVLMAMILQLPFLAAVTGFSTYFFAFWLLLTAYAFFRDRFALMLIAGLFSCLVRPDGCLYVCPLIALAFMTKPQLVFKAKNLGALIGCFAVGAGYFLWRWHYFGLLVPLPFYVKSDIPHVLGFFNMSAVYQELEFLKICLPIIVYILYAGRKTLFSSASLKIHILVVSYMLVPLVCYASMDLFQNIYYRYHFPLMMSFMLLALLQRSPQSEGKFLLCIALSLGLQFKEYIIFSYLNGLPQPLISIAQDIGKLDYKGKLVTGEAGIFPYYTGWNTYDMYGLDTPSVALHEVQPGDIKNFNPDLVYVFHAKHFHDTHVPPNRYDKMIAVLRGDMAGQPYDIYKFNGVYYFIINRNSPAYKELVNIMRAHGAEPTVIE